MLTAAESFWESIKGKVRQLCKSETQNALKVERYTVTTAPNGTVMGVTLPYGTTELALPYSKEVAKASVGNTVLVAWWGSMSNAKVYYYANGYDGAPASLAVAASDYFQNNPFSNQGTTLSIYQNGKTVSVYFTWTSGNTPAADTANCIATAFRPSNTYAILPIYSRTSPYVQVGTIWIGSNGRVQFYGESGGGYSFGTYLV